MMSRGRSNGGVRNDWWAIIFFIGIFIFLIGDLLFSLVDFDSLDVFFSNKSFKIIASTSTKNLDEYLISYASDNGIDLEIEHYGDLEIVDMLNDDSSDYDAVWISNSIWLYMLDNSSIVTDSKSIVIDPVVMAIDKSKAVELGFVDSDIYNSDILNAIRDGELKYIMASVTKTNTGATSYLTFLNSLAGSPEVLTESMLEDEKLGEDLKDLFAGVERVSGDEEYLVSMYKQGNYNAMINYESSLIELNKELVSDGEDPLYLVYPVDGVAINDMPFAYINNDSTDTEKREEFLLLQSYLTSDYMIGEMESLGYRSWYGGIKEDTDDGVFNPDWGIDTSKYLKDMNYPSKSVITKALNLYIDKFRKPTHVVFCLDVSGSMYGSGLRELKDAMYSILDYETASADMLQFSDTDKITVITFSSDVKKIYETRYGNDTDAIIDDINNLVANGSTNIYDPSIESLKILSDDTDDYTKTVILLTDGESNKGDFISLKDYYIENKLDIPIYSITFGNSSLEQLTEIADLTNAKVFDGKSGLKEAFAEVRSYN